MTEQLQFRVYGDPSKPVLVYLPGLHGDWTLIGGFREALGGRAPFVEFTYPRTLTWSLDDYAEAIEKALASRGITRGWLLGESFGSQIAWSIVSRKRFQVDGLILAGGFGRHPMHWGVKLAERLFASIPLGVLTRITFGYARLARFRYRHAPVTLAGIQEFVDRRTEPDRRAAVHRLQLVGRSDPTAVARAMSAPVYALTGMLDPIVPWFLVRPWLKKNCSQLRQYQMIRHADHNVLGTAPDAAAEHVVGWMGEKA
jgi:pimeloyl-ACP methyl ester carboxylesterase